MPWLAATTEMPYFLPSFMSFGNVTSLASLCASSRTTARRSLSACPQRNISR